MGTGLPLAQRGAMKSIQGLTLIEMIVVLAVLGVLLAISSRFIQSDRIAVTQAAQIIGAQVNRARLEAIKQNTVAGLYVASASGASAGEVKVFADTNTNNAYDAGTDKVVSNVPIGQGDLAKVRVELWDCSAGAAGTTPGTLLFNQRGIMQPPARSIQVRNSDSSAFRYVVVSSQGRVRVLSACP